MSNAANDTITSTRPHLLKVPLPLSTATLEMKSSLYEPFEGTLK